MSNPSKAKGTRAETTLVKFWTGQGIPCHRTPLAGTQDQGDIHACNKRVVVQVKAHTRQPSNLQVAGWWRETSQQADRVPESDVALLVLKPPGVGVTRISGWWCWLTLADLWWLGGSNPEELPPHLRDHLTRIDMYTATVLILDNPHLKDTLTP